MCKSSACRSLDGSDRLSGDNRLGLWLDSQDSQVPLQLAFFGQGPFSILASGAARQCISPGSTCRGTPHAPLQPPLSKPRSCDCTSTDPTPALVRFLLDTSPSIIFSREVLVGVHTLCCSRTGHGSRETRFWIFGRWREWIGSRLRSSQPRWTRKWRNLSKDHWWGR
jgi:hypothetical protein